MLWRSNEVLIHLLCRVGDWHWETYECLVDGAEAAGAELLLKQQRGRQVGRRALCAVQMCVRRINRHRDHTTLHRRHLLLRAYLLLPVAHLLLLNIQWLLLLAINSCVCLKIEKVVLTGIELTGTLSSLANEYRKILLPMVAIRINVCNRKGMRFGGTQVYKVISLSRTTIPSPSILQYNSIFP